MRGKIFTKKNLLAFLLIAAIIILSDATPLNDIVIRIFSPAQSILAQAALRVPLPNFIKKKEGDIEREQKQLKAENQKLLTENLKIKREIQEIKNLEKHFQYLQTQKFQYISAKVIAKENGYNTLVIDKGKADGLKPEYPAVADEGVLLGKILEVENSSSKIILLTHPEMRLTVSKFGEDDISGILSGVDNYYMKMELIPADKIISPEDKIVTSGKDDFIPQGLIVGSVERLENQGTSYFKTALIKPYFGVNALASVSILKTNE